MIFLAEGTSGAGGLMDSPITLILTIVMLVGMVVFMVISTRKQKKQENEIKNMRDKLQVGDEVTTIGGIIGRVVRIKDETCVIETGHDRMKIRILRSAISKVDVKAEDTKD